MNCPRRRTVRSASAKDNVPAATCAEYSPRLWPAANDGGNAARRHCAADGDAHGQDRRLRVFGEQQLRLWTLEAQAAQRLAKRIVGLVERLPTDRECIGQGLAHSDFLRALAGKDECNHARPRTIRKLARNSFGSRNGRRSPRTHCLVFAGTILVPAADANLGAAEPAPSSVS